MKTIELGALAVAVAITAGIAVVCVGLGMLVDAVMPAPRALRDKRQSWREVMRRMVADASGEQSRRLEAEAAVLIRMGFTDDELIVSTAPDGKKQVVPRAFVESTGDTKSGRPPKPKPSPPPPPPLR
jgi:hypothetical protein